MPNSNKFEYALESGNATVSLEVGSFMTVPDMVHELRMKIPWGFRQKGLDSTAKSSFCKIEMTWLYGMTDEQARRLLEVEGFVARV